ERGAGEVLDRSAPTDMRQPVIGPGEHRKYETADQNVVQVCDDEMGIMRLPVKRSHGEHDARQPADHEDEKETEDVKHGDGKARAAMADSGQPGEDLDGGRNGDQSAGGGEEGEPDMRNSDRVHMVDPEAEGQKRHGYQSRDDDAVTDKRDTCKHREDR